MATMARSSWNDCAYHWEKDLVVSWDIQVNIASTNRNLQWSAYRKSWFNWPCGFRTVAVRALYMNLWNGSCTQISIIYHTFRYIFMVSDRNSGNWTPNWIIKSKSLIQGCEPRFARLSCLHTKNACNQLIMLQDYWTLIDATKNHNLAFFSW